MPSDAKKNKALKKKQNARGASNAKTGADNKDTASTEKIKECNDSSDESVLNDFDNDADFVGESDLNAKRIRPLKKKQNSRGSYVKSGADSLETALIDKKEACNDSSDESMISDSDNDAKFISESNSDANKNKDMKEEQNAQSASNAKTGSYSKKTASVEKIKKDESAINGFNNDAEFVGKSDSLRSADEDEARYNELAHELESMNLLSESVAAHRTVTGVLHSHKDSRDVHINLLSITFHGKELLVDSEIHLNNKNRYGLIGQNGCGKSTLLAVLANREVPVPDHIDIFLLQREMAPSRKTALQCVMDVDKERKRLEAEAEELAFKSESDADIMDRLMEVEDRLSAIDSQNAETRAAELLFGLGFTKEMQNKQVKHFSGGWRMRIALARALYLKPALLLLDEPTNHLDLSACVWLENELKDYPRCLMIISHSQDFLNGVCNRIINMNLKKLTTFRGNYDNFVDTKDQLDEFQQREYDKQQEDIKKQKDFINRFGHGTKKMARQAQSREKNLKRMLQDNTVEAVAKEKRYVRGLSFRYHPDKPYIYKNLDLGVDLDTRAALVGPNGAGKSTLLKLIAKELDPSDGLITRHTQVRMGRFHQHLHEKLDLKANAIQWLQQQFPDLIEIDDVRKMLGRYGLTGAQQTCEIRTLSDGQRCRIIFAYIAKITPHILLMDEPTNHLDIQTIDALADAIQAFEGGLLLVSHDFRLISQVAKELWVCDKQTVTKWDGDIFSYKKQLRKEVRENMKSLTMVER
ncbi:ATP-binding cassette sub- F member 2 [Cichlidogyrus casuarinus]|uniref:ATP-binding cassette sub- F member 2 n=1 Tax=Cichlidogyrus casuarinus TaxID=1844966 RepID=A0ABD2Q4V6_9PLAT